MGLWVDWLANWWAGLGLLGLVDWSIQMFGWLVGSFVGMVVGGLVGLFWLAVLVRIVLFVGWVVDWCAREIGALNGRLV